MELRQLRYFAAVAEHLHYGRAAAQLNIAQPPLSQQITRLERDLGVRLFHRTSRSVELTEEGRLLLDAARRVLGEADHVRDLAAALRAGTAGRLRIAFVASVLNWGLAGRLRQFRERYPDAEITATQMPVIDQVQALRDSEIDVGFTLSRLDYDHLSVHDIAVEPVMAILPVDHPLAGVDTVPLAGLAQETFISWRAPFDEHLDDFVTRACAAAGFTPRRAFHGAQSHTIVHMVAAGFGVALGPACDRRITVDGVVFKDLAEPVPTVTLSAVRHRWRRSPVADRLVELMVDPSIGIR